MDDDKVDQIKVEEILKLDGGGIKSIFLLILNTKI
jgi:hypothetical protein